MEYQEREKLTDLLEAVLCVDMTWNNIPHIWEVCQLVKLLS
jgi:hypothetical protein